MPPRSFARDSRLASLRHQPTMLLAGAALAIALLALVLASVVRANAPAPGDASAALVGRSLPQIALPAEQGGQLDGTRPLLPRDGEGHPALVLFVFSLCPRCPTEAAAVSALARQRGLSLVVVDSPAETPAIAGAYAGRLGLSGPVLLDRSGALATRLGIRDYPALLLVDTHGAVRDVWLGETPLRTVSAAVAGLAP